MDFYLPETRELIQVSQNLAQPATRERETRALTDALAGLGLTRGLILTDANTAPIETDGLELEVRSWPSGCCNHRQRIPQVRRREKPTTSAPVGR